jgi:SAM-dependent methyltransferase
MAVVSIEIRHHLQRARITVFTSIFAVMAMPHPALSEDSVGTQDLSPSKISLQREYNSYSSNYNDLDGGSIASTLGIDSMRTTAGLNVDGNVLEVALGTGLQSKFYDWVRIRSFTGVDLSQGMLEEAKKSIPKVAAATGNPNVKIEIRQMDAERLEFADDTFDTTVDTFSMCVIPQPGEAIAEMGRVTRKGGKVVLLENSVSTNGIVAWIQNIMEPVVTPLSKGCRWNVDVPKLADDAGLKLERYESIQAGTVMLGVYRKN